MERILEKEIMDDMNQVNAYSKANFSDSNNLFSNSLIRKHSSRINKVIDIGTGTCDIPISLISRKNNIFVTAIDASKLMVDISLKRVKNAGYNKNIEVVNCSISEINDDINFDTIISKDLLHHLPDINIIFNFFKKYKNMNTLIYVMDLIRPNSKEEANKIVENISANESSILKKDFYNSLLAAFTLEEIKLKLEEYSFSLNVTRVSERHMIIEGII